MHMLSRKDLNSAELETFRVSRNPATGIPATGEVQTQEEATVYVHDLERFVTIQILEDTPAFLSGKLCEEHGYSYEWVSGQKAHLTEKWQKTSNATLRIVYRLLSQDYRRVLPARVHVRLLHRYRKDTSDDNSSSPATTRSDSTSIPASENRWRDPI